MRLLDRLFGRSLHKAAEDGDLQRVKDLVRRGADVNQPASTVDGEPPILRAAAKGHLEVVRFLLDNGADPNACTREGGTALHYATSHPMVVQLLLARGADANRQDHNGATPLHFAAVKGDVEACRLLVQGGGQVNAKDRFGRTAFQLAASKGHVEVAQVLFVLGADEPLKAAEQRLAGGKPPADDYVARKVDRVLSAAFAGVAKTSQGGHPICPSCGHEFPIPEQIMREQSPGIPAFMCPACNHMIRFKM